MLTSSTAAPPRPPSAREIAQAKERGLEIDVAAAARREPSALPPEDRYRLKTKGLCAERREGQFAARIRIPGGRLTADQARAIAAAAAEHASGWIHLTTRQGAELHGLSLGQAPSVTERLSAAGLSTSSTCGHTIRNVMACPDSGTSIDEPFDVYPDAAFLSQALMARSRDLNRVLPERLNISLGACTRCRDFAMVSDIGLLPTVEGGKAGYRLVAGGGLGSSPQLAVALWSYLPRDELLPAVWALIRYLCEESPASKPGRARLRHLIAARGVARLRRGFSRRFTEELANEHQPAPPIEIPESGGESAPWAVAPLSGWNRYVRAERRPGFATVTVRVPLGDILADELQALAGLAAGCGDGNVQLTAGQSAHLRSVPIEQVPGLLDELDALGLGHTGHTGPPVTACPGTASCLRAISDSQAGALAAERALGSCISAGPAMTIAVSGCPSSCARQQLAAIGLTGCKVAVHGRAVAGFQLSVGADPDSGCLGEPVAKVAPENAGEAVRLLGEIWSAEHRPGESPGITFRRLGLERIRASLALRLDQPDHDQPDRGAA